MEILYGCWYVMLLSLVVVGFLTATDTFTFTSRNMLVFFYSQSVFP